MTPATNPKPPRIDKIRTAVGDRRKQDRMLREAVERVAREYEEGRGATACMAEIAAVLAQPAPAKPEAPPVAITPAIRAQLRTLAASAPMGCTRAPGGWIGTGGRIALDAVAPLVAGGLAFVDRKQRHPRLKITKRGRSEIKS
ncbi:hypothetical protein [Aureimonas sp. ME7]|uniref:hypothetical protein n=1 Tax=Aureimonas sp. ME7 TaxID=2744252 RepID=UPI0015F8D60C|nr:hypothetical protein [Aureimonas sp. ME7]